MILAALALLPACPRSKKPQPEPSVLGAPTAPASSRSPGDPAGPGSPAAAAASRSPGDPAVRSAPEGQVFLAVGAHTFSRADVELREKVIRFKYGDVEDGAVKAVSQLVQGYLWVSLLASLGAPVTWEELQKEVERIDRSTQAPEDLAKIKAIFGPAPSGNAASRDQGKQIDWDYALLFVLPDYANRRYFYDVFPKQKHLQKEKLDKANRALEELRKQEAPDLEAFAKKNDGFRRDRVLFSAGRGFRPMPDPGRPELPEPPEREDDGILPPDATPWQKMNEEIFKKTDQGALFGQVVELETVFLILRWTGWDEDKEKKTKARVVERLLLEKRSPHEFFETESAKVPLRLADPALKDALRKKISWARDLKWAD